MCEILSIIYYDAATLKTRHCRPEARAWSHAGAGSTALWHKCRSKQGHKNCRCNVLCSDAAVRPAAAAAHTPPAKQSEKHYSVHFRVHFCVDLQSSRLMLLLPLLALTKSFTHSPWHLLNSSS